jgi:NAD(P)-dependent dehydrogenase (short-subunit alcohol dehydrogenase family)
MARRVLCAAHGRSPLDIEPNRSRAEAAIPKAIADEAIKSRIRVNSVAPGPIWTPLIPSTMPPDHVAKFGANTPVGRAGQPVELAPIYVFLASSKSSYITGEVIGATGGRPLG